MLACNVITSGADAGPMGQGPENEKGAPREYPRRAPVFCQPPADHRSASMKQLAPRRQAVPGAARRSGCIRQ